MTSATFFTVKSFRLITVSSILSSGNSAEPVGIHLPDRLPGNAVHHRSTGRTAPRRDQSRGWPYRSGRAGSEIRSTVRFTSVALESGVSTARSAWAMMPTMRSFSTTGIRRT
jgi:hypothetical protein